MKERIIKFLESENLSSSKFADDIGVQRSTVSHILSGRNNPSFDFIQKILLKYKNLNAEWLIIGTGNMIKNVKLGNLFENTSQESNISSEIINEEEILKPKKDKNEISGIINEQKNTSEKTNKNNNHVTPRNIEKIITVYSDNTFDLYLPSK